MAPPNEKPPWGGGLGGVGRRRPGLKVGFPGNPGRFDLEEWVTETGEVLGVHTPLYPHPGCIVGITVKPWVSPHPE